MIRFSRTATLAALVLLATLPAHAYERRGAFIGGGLGIGTINLSAEGEAATDPSYDDSSLTLAAQGGYRFNRWFALEGGVAGAANDGDSSFNESSFGGLTAFAVGLVPVGERVDLFARLGFHSSSSETGFSGDEDESGAAYGAGLQVNLGSGGNFGIRTEYTTYRCDNLFDDVSGVVVSFQYNFFRRQPSGR
jgi:OmpA-OmpF porin, OOP family